MRFSATALTRCSGACRVRKSSTGKPEITSVVYSVSSLEMTSGVPLFPDTNRNNFCYVIVDPMRKVCRWLYHAHAGFW